MGFTSSSYWLLVRTESLYISPIFPYSLSLSLLTQRLVYTLNTYVPLTVIAHERSLEHYPKSTNPCPVTFGMGWVATSYHIYVQYMRIYSIPTVLASRL